MKRQVNLCLTNPSIKAHEDVFFRLRTSPRMTLDRFGIRGNRIMNKGKPKIPLWWTRDPDRFIILIVGDLNPWVKWMERFVSEIKRQLEESAEIKRAMAAKLAPEIARMTRMASETLIGGGKILVFGNGGSASDALHFAAELVGRFKMDRAALPAICLNSNMSCLTAIGNDYGYDMTFARQVAAFALKGDMVVGITTSGNSRNVVAALREAKERSAKAVALTGGSGGEAADLADLSIKIPSGDTARVQEGHITVIHIVCDLLEREMFGGQ